MLETMGIPLAILFTLAGLALAVLLGIVLYKNDPKEARERGASLTLQEE
jgi:hypothetical protein